MEYTKTILTISVHQSTENPVFGEGSTHVTIVDDASGPYIKLIQCNDNAENGTVAFNDIGEIVAVYSAAKQLLDQFNQR